MNFSIHPSLNTCYINKTDISSEDYFLGSEFDTTVERFHISYNKEVHYLPKNIGEKFPNMKEFQVWSCGLLVIRNHYLKSMLNLRELHLSNNEITTIESVAFLDLISLKEMYLDYNKIETFDENLFATMVNLEFINLSNNQIKFLSPKTFDISSGKLRKIDLRNNVCTNGWYDSIGWKRLDAVPKAFCSQ